MIVKLQNYLSYREIFVIYPLHCGGVLHGQAANSTGQLPVWISCNVRRWVSNLYLDLARFAFQASISLGAAARQRLLLRGDRHLCLAIYNE